MEIGSLIRIALTAGVEKTIPAVSGLKIGDVLRVEVLDVVDNHRALLDFGPFRTLAEVSFPVQAGEELIVRVLATQGQLRLQRMPPEEDSAAAAGSRAALGPVAGDALNRLQLELGRFLESYPRGMQAQALPAELRQRLVELHADLSPLPPETGPAEAASRMHGLCEDSGVFFEKRVAAALTRLNPEDHGADSRPPGEQAVVQRILATDLKPRLAAVRHLLENRTPELPLLQPKEAAALSRCVTEMLAEISRQQEQIAVRRDDPDPFQVIHFSLPIRDGRNRARLKVGYPKNRSGRGRQGHRAALLLDLDRLGSTRADLSMLPGSLTVAFFVGEGAARRLIESHAGEIQQALAPFFENVRVTVAVSKKKIAAFETEELQPAGRRRLDVRA